MFTLKSKSKGFTIVELLIVIVVIGILATLVIVTFTGIQKKARDSQRQTDINALDSHIEAFYASNGYYPNLTDMQSPSFISGNLKGLDQAALADPNTPAGDIDGTHTGIKGTADSKHYGYKVTQSDGTTSCESDDTTCAVFTLTADLEGGGTFTKSSNT
jgi:prepilin-type N-terminal cleavage/methylation domain-containing protein